MEILHRLWDRAGGVWKHKEPLQAAASAHSACQGERCTPPLPGLIKHLEVFPKLTTCYLHALKVWLLDTLFFKLTLETHHPSDNGWSPLLAQVWISYAKFELSIESPERLQKCRTIYEEANKGMRSCEEKEERLMLLESWSDFEIEFGSDSTRDRVRKLLPEKVKKRRKLTAEDGVRSFIKSGKIRVHNIDRCHQDFKCF